MADATNKIAGKGKLGPEAAAQGASLVSDGVALMSKVTTAPSPTAAASTLASIGNIGKSTGASATLATEAGSGEPGQNMRSNDDRPQPWP